MSVRSIKGVFKLMLKVLLNVIFNLMVDMGPDFMINNMSQILN
jgi:hypothetical protein